MKLFRKNSTKKKLDKCMKGSISVLLCILLTPFLTIACYLVEFYRYQSDLETIQEVVDVSAYGTLADYDKYLHDRFGLVALSQDVDAQEVFDAMMSTNKNMVSNGVTVGGSTITMRKPLSTTNSDGLRNVMMNQLTDFGETTALTQFMFDGLNLSELMDKFSALEGISHIADGATAMADLTGAVKDLVQSGQDLYDTIKKIPSQLQTIQTEGTNVTNAIAALYEELCNAQYAFDENDKAASLTQVVQQSLTKLMDIYDALEALQGEVSSLKSTLNSLDGKIDSMETALGNAKDALDTLKGTMGEITSSKQTGGEDKNLDEAVEKSNSLYEQVFNDLKKVFDDTLKDLKEGIISDLRGALNTVSEEIELQWPILNINEDYFKLPLSEEAKADIELLIQAIPNTWDEEEKQTYLNDIKNTYLGSLLDLSGFNFGTIIQTIKDAVQNAQDQIQEKVKEAIIKVLEALVNTIKNLFTMDGMYNPDLDALLSEAASAGLASTDSPYQHLLNAIQQIFNAVENAKSVLQGEWWNLLSAAKNLYEGVKEVVQALITAVDQTINKLKSLAGYFTGGNEASIFDLLLLSAYMSYNLPCRTNAKGFSLGEDLTSYQVPLEDSALTGYDYNDIVRPSTPTLPGLGEPNEGMEGLVEFAERDALYGSHNMFKGAELEYIIAGTTSEVMNQIVTFMDIFVIRLLLDAVTVFTDPNVATMAAGATVAGWIVYILVLIGEPLVDTILICNGGEVPLFKKGCYLTPVGLVKLLDALPKGLSSVLTEATSGITGLGNGGKDFDLDGVSLSYQDYCVLIIMMTLTEITILNRFGNIVQLEANAKYGEGKFSLDKAYTSIEITVPIELNSLLAVVDFGDKFSADIKRERGY